MFTVILTVVVTLVAVGFYELKNPGNVGELANTVKNWF